MATVWPSSNNKHKKQVQPLSLFISLLLTLTAFLSQYCLASEQTQDLSIKALLNAEVSSVTKKSQRFATSAAAVHVVSSDDIRNSGVTTIADALKLAAGLSVNQIDSNKWSVASRGFGGRFSNKLLVLLDGRSLYNNSYAGVYWESINVPLDDIERIEVIRGPGATLWGTNAVNGVINIITRHSSDTIGNYAEIITGDHEYGFHYRYGYRLAPEDSTARLYIKAKAVDSYETIGGSDAHDNWSSASIGFRSDIHTKNNRYMLQSELSQSTFNWMILAPTEASPTHQQANQVESTGFHLVGEYHQSDKSKIKSSYEYFNRSSLISKETIHSIYTEYQSTYTIDNHDFIYGTGILGSENSIDSTNYVSLENPKSSQILLNGFIQDEVSLIDDVLRVTAGAKIELQRGNINLLPTIKVFWSIKLNHNVWASVSKAVRNPSRSETEAKVRIGSFLRETPFGRIPVNVQISPNDSIKEESLWATELGYRCTPISNLHIDTAIFYNNYSGLRLANRQETIIDLPNITQTYAFENALSGVVYGMEISASYVPSTTSKLELFYSYMNGKSSKIPADAIELDRFSSPYTQYSLKYDQRVSKNIHTNIWMNYYDRLKLTSSSSISQNFDTIRKSYFDLNANIIWQASENLTISLTGRRLFEGGQNEYTMESFLGEIKITPNYHLKISYKY